MLDEDAVHNVVDFSDFGDLVCIDDIQAAAGSSELEKLLFNLIEQQWARGGGILIASAQSLQFLPVSMPDLLSRLRSGAAYRLRTLDDAQKRQAMRLRARHRGFDLSDEVIDYVMTRFPRDTTALFALLDRIDRASLSSKRKVTVPFVRGLEAEGDH